jgi:hypothetical protein
VIAVAGACGSSPNTSPPDAQVIDFPDAPTQADARVSVDASAPADGATPSDAGNTGNDGGTVGKDAGGAGSADAFVADAPGPSAVTGKRDFIFINEAATPTVNPEDLTSATIEAIASDGTHAATGLADGTFTTPAFPAGTYTLHFQDGFFIPSWTATTSHTPDLSIAGLGRPDAVAVTTAGTNTAGTRLRLNMTNLDTWKANDALEVYIGNTGDFVSVTNTPTVGDTRLNNLVVPFSTNDFLVNDGTTPAGDVVYITQLKDTTSGTGEVYQVLDRYFAATGVMLTDNTRADISGVGFANVTQNQSLALKWNRSAYETYVASMGPGLADDFDSFFIVAQPGGTGNGILYPNADVLIYIPNADTTDLDAGTIMWGNPFPTSWGLIANIERDYVTSYTDGTNTWSVFASMIQDYDASTLAAKSPFVPTLGPATSVKLDGADASTAQNITSATPTISWSAPTLGTATDYTVTVFLLDPATTPDATPVAFFSTKGTSVQVPTGVLTTGSLYFVRVTAFNRVVDTNTTPFLDGTPEMSTDYLTAMLTASF